MRNEHHHDLSFDMNIQLAQNGCEEQSNKATIEDMLIRGRIIN